ncbi:MAG: PaaX family transcriptional regulator C-terminal domain-containing protein [Opitutaceae bacterium]|nr:PaaX family transcriptional regulator C-terminal domain-containing protein [Opitutaceae bacterium]
MKAATEEFLYLLLWTAESLARPSWRNLDSAFETWAYRNGLGKRLKELEQQKLIERAAPAVDKRLYRLTETGRCAALGGVDPLHRWSRPWDGRWRLVFFDIPEVKRRERLRLRRTLQKMGFGYLQNSVWLSPDPLESIRCSLLGMKANVESLTLFEGQPCGGESDRDLVAGAWDFEAINRRYEMWGRVADAVPRSQNGRWNFANLRAWAARERAIWQEVVAIDPFLPEPLLPVAYLGRRAWIRRSSVLNTLGNTLA